MDEFGPGGDAEPPPPTIPPTPTAKISPFTNDSIFNLNIERNPITYSPSVQGKEEDQHSRHQHKTASAS
jgi:hypothetical protein